MAATIRAANSALLHQWAEGDAMVDTSPAGGDGDNDQGETNGKYFDQ